MHGKLRFQGCNSNQNKHHNMFTSGDASPISNMKRSESSQSVRSQMWDSADPTRNPAPLPLPERGPISAVKTQSKISAAHQRLSSPSREEVSLYDLVTMIHSNLEILMKRSQNNARDLGRLRGDVKNPQVVDEIRKLLQESSLHDTDDTAMKLDALIKGQPENKLMEAIERIQRTIDTPAAINTSALQSTILDLNTQISQKIGELQTLDTTLFNRRTELAELESRSTTLQNSLNTMLAQVRDVREQEEIRQKALEERDKKKSIGRRALVPLGTDRRIASLNVPRRAPKSPFTEIFTLPNSVDPAGAEIKISPVKPMLTTLRTPPRKTSWSQRVSGLFGKENEFRSFSHR